jgi:hypothetical protein
MPSPPAHPHFILLITLDPLAMGVWKSGSDISDEALHSRSPTRRPTDARNQIGRGVLSPLPEGMFGAKSMLKPRSKMLSLLEAEIRYGLP